ncbi:MAG TPA: hypothetical protein VN231_06110 [Allosphingosinicella sp.]|nr:hypothetical protein [Allosphingosinicella sp.]
MPDFLPLPMTGTAAQWSAVTLLLAILVAVLRYLPERSRAETERKRARTAAEDAAAERWRDIEARVSRELEECRRDREHDAAHRQRIDDENFRLRVVITLLIDEVERLDPQSQVILKARTILTVPPASPTEPPDLERVRLDELLERLPEGPRVPKRKARGEGKGP